MWKQMLWKTHLRISFEVLKILGICLSDEVAESYKNGILAPDQWKDFPHHYGKSDMIKTYLMKSREYFLRDDFRNALFHLGVALHYIQDSYTSYASFYPKHNSWEESIEYASFTYDLERTIRDSLNNKWWERDRCLQLANILSKKAQGRDSTLYMATLTGHAPSRSFAKPIVDLNLALRASFVVAESVLSSKRCIALEDKLKNELLNCESLMKAAETELSDKILRLVNERDDLEKRKVTQTGLFSRMKNWSLEIRIVFKNSALKFSSNDYSGKKHLEKVIREYMRVANMTIIPYTGWYNYEIPKVSQNVIERKLLSVQEIAESLGQNEHVLKRSLNNANIPIYKVGNTEIVRRAELDKFQVIKTP